MRVVCDHCGNGVWSSWGNTGIVDGAAKVLGWRPSQTRPPAPAGRSAAERDEAEQVARELRALGLDADAGEVADWLDEDRTPGLEDRPAGLEHPPAGLGAAVDWLERAEASQTPMRREIADRLAPGSWMREDIAWQRTAEGLLACSGHCFEQLSTCTTCNLPRVAPAHRGCPSYVAPCTDHAAEVIPFPRPPR